MAEACASNHRKDGQISITEIIATRPGASSELLEMVKEYGRKKEAKSIFAKCPATWQANKWYEKKGFEFVGTEGEATRINRQAFSRPKK